MTPQVDLGFHPRIAEWLEADPDRAPNPVLETVLAAATIAFDPADAPAVIGTVALDDAGCTSRGNLSDRALRHRVARPPDDAPAGLSAAGAVTHSTFESLDQ